MDFKTTEAAEDLGRLARTIAESVSTPNVSVSSTGSKNVSMARCGAN